MLTASAKSENTSSDQSFVVCGMTFVFVVDVVPQVLLLLFSFLLMKLIQLGRRS